MHCPGSVKAEQSAPPRPSGPAAEAGTAAHELFARALLDQVPAAELTEDPAVVQPLQVALDAARQVIAGRPFKVELRLPPLPGLPLIWGTVDCIVFDAAGRAADILDLKFGRQTIEPGCEQLQVYALLAAQRFGASATGIVAHIIQPRRLHVEGLHRTQRHSVEDLGQLLVALQRVSEEVEQEQPPRHAGVWCQYCAAAPECLERQAAQPPVRPVESPWLPAGACSMPENA
jgi:hypothetical protein